MRTVYCRLVTAIAILAVPGGLAAQELDLGQWSGTLSLSQGPVLAVVYHVTRPGGAYHVTMNVVDGPPSEVTNIELQNETLTFQWGAFACELQRQNNGRFLGICVGGGGTSELTLVPPMPDAVDDGSGKDVLTTADLVRTRASSVYDALQRLRPQWLRPRGPARIGYNVVVRVYIDNQPIGGLDFLRSLDPEAIAEVRFYTASEANMRFSGDNDGGAIVLTRRH